MYVCVCVCVCGVTEVGLSFYSTSSQSLRGNAKVLAVRLLGLEQRLPLLQVHGVKRTLRTEEKTAQAVGTTSHINQICEQRDVNIERIWEHREESLASASIRRAARTTGTHTHAAGHCPSSCHSNLLASGIGFGAHTYTRLYTQMHTLTHANTHKCTYTLLSFPASSFASCAGPFSHHTQTHTRTHTHTYTQTPPAACTDFHARSRPPSLFLLLALPLRLVLGPYQAQVSPPLLQQQQQQQQWGADLRAKGCLILVRMCLCTTFRVPTTSVFASRICLGTVGYRQGMYLVVCVCLCLRVCVRVCVCVCLCCQRWAKAAGTVPCVLCASLQSGVGSRQGQCPVFSCVRTGLVEAQGTRITCRQTQDVKSLNIHVSLGKCDVKQTYP